ncbi:MAG: hypothetical protein ACREOI_08735 [bacterium]
MSRDLKSFTAIVALFSLLSFALFACGQKEGERDNSATVAVAEELDFLNLDPKTKYVGDEECALCHSETSDVIHANFTDHWIQKEPAAPQAARASIAPTLKDFFAEKDSAADLRLGMAYLQFYDAANKERANFEQALALVRDRLQNDPQNEEGLYRLGLAYFSRGRLEEALQ